MKWLSMMRRAAKLTLIAIDSIIEWASNKPDWQQDALHRVLWTSISYTDSSRYRFFSFP